MRCCCPDSRKNTFIDPALLKKATITTNEQKQVPQLSTHGFFPSGLALPSSKCLIAERISLLLSCTDSRLLEEVWSFARPRCTAHTVVISDKRRDPVILDTAGEDGDFLLWTVQSQLVISGPQGLGVALPGALEPSLIVWSHLKKLYASVVEALGKTEAKSTIIALEYGCFVIKALADTDWFISAIDTLTGEVQYAFHFPDSGCFISPGVYFGLGKGFPDPAPGCFYCVDLENNAGIQTRAIFNDPLEVDLVKWRTRWIKNDASPMFEFGLLFFEMEARLRDNSLQNIGFRLRFLEPVPDSENDWTVTEPRVIGERTIVTISTFNNINRLVGRFDQNSILTESEDREGLGFSTFDEGEQFPGRFNARPKMTFVDSDGVIWEVHYNTPTEVNIPISLDLTP